MPRKNRSRKAIGGAGFFSNWWDSLTGSPYGSQPGYGYGSQPTSYGTQSSYGYGSQPTSYGYGSQPTSYGMQSRYRSQPTGYGMQSSYRPTSYGYGGRKQGSRRMKGGFNDNTPTSGLAAHAAPFSGVTAKPHTLVGGKTRRRGRGRKSRKH